MKVEKAKSNWGQPDAAAPAEVVIPTPAPVDLAFVVPGVQPAHQSLGYLVAVEDMTLANPLLALGNGLNPISGGTTVSNQFEVLLEADVNQVEASISSPIHAKALILAEKDNLHAPCTLD
ncbi:hypothetical protein ACH5RR_032583 [Cinchona calisaya]|uniref:Uncharacterized protein n=1 Tax=Cinchona calisaya TaxID=153742 RepID=A0ABD2YIJ7_9GENT